MEYFEVIEELRLLACRTCSTCITRKRLTTHLKAKPHQLTKQEIEKATTWAEALDIVGDDDELRSVPTLSDDHEPIEALGQPGKNGLGCTYTDDCIFVAVANRKIREHLRKEHNWDQCLGPGRKRAGPRDESLPWRTGVYYQRLFASGLRSGYFEVARGRDLEGEMKGELVQQRAMDEMADLFGGKVRTIREKETENIDNPNEFLAPNAWLNRLGAARHLKDFGEKKEFMRGLLSLEYDTESGDPTRCDDSALRVIHAAFYRVKNQAKNCTRPDIMSWNALFEVNRKDMATERTRPFHFHRKPTTEKRYTQVCFQLLAYIVRVMTIEDEEERPPFRLTERQEAAYETIMDDADLLGEAKEAANGDMEGTALRTLSVRLEKDVMELFMSVLDHHTKATEYESVLVSFLMVLSIRADHGWEDFSGFTPRLSAIATMARLFIVKHAVDERAAAIEAREKKGMARREAEQDSPGHFDLVADMTRRFMVMGGEGTWTTPMQFIFRLRNFGMGAHNSTAGRGSVSWDKEDIVFKGNRINLQDIQGMLCLALGKAEALLYGKLLFYEDFTEQEPSELGLPAIRWDEISDDASDMAVGVSLADALYRMDGDRSKGWLFQRIWASDKLRRRFFRDPESGSLEPSIKEVHRYGEDLDTMLQLLLFLVHLSSGQAARGPELLTIRLRNTADGGMRNVLFDRGLVMIVTGIHKGYSRSEKEKVIHRFLPREIGTLLVYYAWLVLEFWEGLQANAGIADSFPATLWGLQESTDPFEQEDYGREDGSDDEEPRAGRTQSTQGSRQGGRRLGPGPYWTPDRMARILRKHSAAGCGKKINISNWRHISIALTRRYFRDQPTSRRGQLLEEMDDADGSDSDGGDDNPWDLQAGHGSAVAGLIYARLLSEGAFETNERRQHFRHISEEWHRLLGFRSAMPEMGGFLKPGHKRKNPSLHHEAMRAGQQQRWRVLRRVDTERALQQLYGEKARFLGLQRKAVDAIMTNKSPVMVIMGTGAGKSLCFMLPAASCPGGITVVVVPLVSLLGDMIQRCRKLNITCAEWKSDRVPGQVAIVFVTPESAMSKRFQDYLEGIRVSAQLDRIVIDECHTILEGCKRFRPRLREISQLGLIGVQMVYLTATLPPRREDDFLDLINTRRADVELLRTRTTRKNVQYSVQATENRGGRRKEAEADAVKDILDRKLDEYAWPSKMVVYCWSVEATESIAEYLGCDAYHREVDLRDGKAERLQAWASGIRRDRYGEGRVIVATNALGLGVDIPDIRVVLHVGMPREMADYAQQSGRAGRDGAASEAIVLARVAQGGSNAARIGDAEFTSIDYTDGTLCRRVVLDSVIDGYRGRDGCSEDEEACDICQGDQRADNDIEDDTEATMREQEVRIQSMRERAKRGLERGEREVEHFHGALEERVKAGCQFCAGSGLATTHTTLGCKRALEAGGLKADVIKTGWRMQEYFRKRGAERFGCCFECFVPQELCTNWVEDGLGGWRRAKIGRCRYDGVVVGVVAYVWKATGTREEAEGLYQKLGFQGNCGKDEEILDWMIARVEWGLTDGNNLCRVFIYMIEDIED